ncbi:MAG: hypothetical protein SGARI_004059, partial [Bacillariaceae sp.]
MVVVQESSRDSVAKQQEKNRIQVLDYVDSLDVSEHSENDDELGDEAPVSTASGSTKTKKKKKKSAVSKSKQKRDSVETAATEPLTVDASTASERTSNISIESEKKENKKKLSIASPADEGMDSSKKKKKSTKKTSKMEGGESSNQPNKSTKKKKKRTSSASEGGIETALESISLERQTNHRMVPVGAVSVEGSDAAAVVGNDGRSSTPQDFGEDGPYQVQATLVEDIPTDPHRDPEAATFTPKIPTVKAEQVSNKKNWKLYAVIAFLLLVVLGMAIGIPLARKDSDSTSERDSEQDSSDSDGNGSDDEEMATSDSPSPGPGFVDTPTMDTFFGDEPT